MQTSLMNGKSVLSVAVICIGLLIIISALRSNPQVIQVFPKPGVPKPEVPKPEVPKPEVPKPEVSKSEVRKPEVQKPATQKPETQDAATQKPEQTAAADKYRPQPANQKAAMQEVPWPKVEASKSSSSKTRRFRFENGIVTFNDDTLLPDDSQLAAMSLAEAELAYEQAVFHTNAFCSTARHYGSKGDGGYDVCTAGIFTPQAPCFTFSFGVGNMWEFDDEMAQMHKCQVMAFDPSMKLGSHQRSSGVIFINAGIFSSKSVLKGWQVDSYAGYLRQLAGENVIVDILKIDVEGSEWPALTTAVEDGSLKNVKQLIFEEHAFDRSKEAYKSRIQILRRLHSLGFRMWRSYWTIYGHRRSVNNKLFSTCCHELNFINVNFLTADARNAPGAKLKDWKEIWTPAKQK